MLSQVGSPQSPQPLAPSVPVISVEAWVCEHVCTGECAWESKVSKPVKAPCHLHIGLLLALFPVT